MKHLQGFACALALLAAALSAPCAKAQGPPADGLYIVRVQGLTATERDAVQAQTGHGTGLQLAYACVPAGILAFRSEEATGRAAKEQAANLLRRRIAAARITEAGNGLAQAEAACAQMRGQ